MAHKFSRGLKKYVILKPVKTENMTSLITWLFWSIWIMMYPIHCHSPSHANRTLCPPNRIHVLDRSSQQDLIFLYFKQNLVFIIIAQAIYETGVIESQVIECSCYSNDTQK